MHGPKIYKYKFVALGFIVNPFSNLKKVNYLQEIA